MTTDLVQIGADITALMEAETQFTTDAANFETAAQMFNTIHSLPNISANVKTDTQKGEAAAIAARTAALLGLSTTQSAALEAQAWLAANTPPPPPPPSNGMAPPPGYSTSQLVLDSNFAKADPTHWTPTMGSGIAGPGPWRMGSLKAPLSAAGNQYDAEYFDPNQVSYGSGGLSLTAVPSSAQSGWTYKSGVLATLGLFTFTGGFVQVRMRIPNSLAGPWAGFWMLPNEAGIQDGPNELDIFEGGYTNTGAPNANYAWTSNCHGSGNTQALVNAGVDLSADYHDYGGEYIPGKSFKTYLDGKLMASFTKNVPTCGMEVILNLQMAKAASGWHSLVGSATPAASVLSVLEAQVYATA